MFEEAEEIEEGGNLDPLGRILGFWGIFFDIFLFFLGGFIPIYQIQVNFYQGL